MKRPSPILLPLGSDRSFIRVCLSIVLFVLAASRICSQTAGNSDPTGFLILGVGGTGGGGGNHLTYLGLGVTKPVVYQRTASVVGTNTITDSGVTWTTDQFAGSNGAHFVEITSVNGSMTATGVGTTYRILSNTSTTLTTPGVTPTPGITPTPGVSPTPAPASQAVNLSTRMRVAGGDNVGIGGFIIAGSAPKHVLLRAIGPSLTLFGVPDALLDPVLELHGPAGFTTIINNNWRDTQEAEILATGIPPTDNSESAIVADLNPGNYTAIVRGNNDSSGVALVEVYDLNASNGSTLANISTRAFVSTGNDVVIAGFILGNNGGDDRLAVRGIGPSLSAAGVPNPLGNPTLELRNNNGALLMANDNWQDDPAQAAQLMAVGLAPTQTLEAALITTLAPGAYTALLAGVNDGTGIGLVEIYDLP